MGRSRGVHTNRWAVMPALAAIVAMLLAGAPAFSATTATGYTIVGFNDLGMHCMDDSYEVFSILPPYNTIHAQLVDASGRLVTNPAGITMTYEAVADPSGSINTSSAGKTNFWQHVAELFGASPPVDEGLTGSKMPGAGNTPQPMVWDGTYHWFTAEGIPLTPYDDSGAKNYYPLMHLVAWDSQGNVLATSDIVLPVSDEMDCRTCHASGSPPDAEPASGWVFDPDPVRDYRLNVLLIHDDRQLGTPAYQTALSDAGYSSAGLYDTVANQGTAVLCARCHGSNALPGTGMSGIPPLTEAVHGKHAYVTDPVTGMALESSANRSACYRCHPGSETRCLRGAMGHATAADASLAIQCQDCHGTMSMVGASTRQGWFDEPRCQSCHTGTADNNSGQIRYLNAFDAPGHYRQAASDVFATNPDTPAAGISLFRFSEGHGGLQCEACHGSTHAIFPSSHGNDNIRNVQLQGHGGTMAECAACHGGQPSTVDGGPHGMHPVGQQWVENHKHAAEGGGGGDDDRAQSTLGSAAQCQACHGTDYRGTVLSRALGDRTVSAFGTKHFWKGYQIGCYTCHNGPGDDDRNPNHPPQVADASASTWLGTGVTLSVQATDSDGDALTLRVVGQPAHGRAGIDGTTLTYVPDPFFIGQDTLTVAAWDGQADSNLGTVTVTTSFFDDVPQGFWAFRWIAILSSSGVTSGCSQNPPLYCPKDVTTRAQMAKFLLKAKWGAGYTPPACTSPPFDDVPCWRWFAPWVAELANEGITQGCHGNDYCPFDAVTRAQMAVFLLRALEGAGYQPPPCTSPPFDDVPCGKWFSPWVAELARRHITTGCHGHDFCPREPVTRAQMAAFLDRAFRLGR